MQFGWVMSIANVHTGIIMAPVWRKLPKDYFLFSQKQNETLFISVIIKNNNIDISFYLSVLFLITKLAHDMIQQHFAMLWIQCYHKLEDRQIKNWHQFVKFSTKKFLGASTYWTWDVYLAMFVGTLYMYYNFMRHNNRIPERIWARTVII